MGLRPVVAGIEHRPTFCQDAFVAPTRRDAVPEDVVLNPFFSDSFGVAPEELEAYGAFDISLVADLPLFIDPFLLFTSEKPAYRALHDEIVRYVSFLRDKAVGQQTVSVDRVVAGRVAATL
jgi:hypothetical protein